MEWRFVRRRNTGGIGNCATQRSFIKSLWIALLANRRRAVAVNFQKIVVGKGFLTLTRASRMGLWQTACRPDRSARSRPGNRENQSGLCGCWPISNRKFAPTSVCTKTAWLPAPVAATTRLHVARRGSVHHRLFFTIVIPAAQKSLYGRCAMRVARMEAVVELRKKKLIIADHAAHPEQGIAKRRAMLFAWISGCCASSWHSRA